MTNALQAALYSIPADDRDTWVQVGMAIKSELGDGGFDLWDSWSRQSDRYKGADARAVWRSIKGRYNGVSIATLYHMAKENGWAGEAPVKTAPSAEEKRQRAEARRREAEERNRREADAAAKAERMLMEAEYVDPRARRARNGRQSDEVPSAHPYLVAKGFAQQGGLVLNGNLLVPMRHYQAYERVQSVQMIGPDGSKKNLPGGKASEAVYKLGQGGERYYCEGYATALSVRAALKRLYRDQHCEAWVCFSAGNIPKVAESRRRSMVIADHDWWRCPKKECRAKWDYESKRCPSCGSSGVTEPAGEKHAKQTGLPYWMPEEPGTDANDVMLSHGVEALADVIRDVHMTAIPRRKVVA